MTEHLMQLEQGNKAESRFGKIGKGISRLAVTSVITFGIGAFSIADRYNTYWNKTIFRVQTVDFNILSHTLPTKLSYTIINNQPEELQRTLDSNYNLFGLIVTDPSGQRIIAATGGKDNKSKSWSAALNPQQLQKSPYDVLLDPPPLSPQWSYKNPRDIERSATNFTNQGRVIGRVYYVRGERPALQDDFFKWLSNPFSESSRIELYTATMLACIGGGVAFWSLWEYLLYKKRVQKEEAEREAIRREEEARRKQEKLKREAERKEEEARQREEEIRKEAERKEEEARHREETLVQQNQTLELQLQERINQITAGQQQFEQERLDSINQAEELRNRNQQLQQEIYQLRETVSSLPTVTIPQVTQVELDKTRAGIELAQQSQRQQEEQIRLLSNQLQVFQNQLIEAKKQGNNAKELQLQIEEIKATKASAESELEQLRSSEVRYRESITSIEKQLLQEQSVREQLNKQLDLLQRSLLESQQQEQESRLKAERAGEQTKLLSEEMERLQEDMGRHPLNKFEQSVLNCLQTGLSEKDVLTQYDAGTGTSNSKFIDFVVVLDSCVIAIEAKSYKGIIEPVGDTRNHNWICRANNGKIRINACWGVNPYQQVKTYVDSLMSRFKQGIYHKTPVYGIVVFPSQATISSTIQSNLGGFHRVATLDKLVEIISSINEAAQNQNKNPVAYKERVKILTGRAS